MVKRVFCFLVILSGFLVSGCWSDRPLNPNTNSHSPSLPFSPTPPDNSVNIPRFVTLKWSCTDPDNDSLTYDVYLDIVNPPVLVVAQGISSNNFNTGLLPSSSVIYWKIKAKDSDGNTTDGQVWRFTTVQ